MPTMADTEAPTTVKPSHDYHAEAHVLSGHVQRPINQKIEPQAPLSLNDRRGGHFTRRIEDFSVEGLISFTRGETRLSGARSLKNNGWVTISTSILEGLNVFEIIGADRLVTQVSTDHAYDNGHIPHVTFLGTQFTNFRVGGFPAAVTLTLDICGDVPAKDQSYFEDAQFLRRVKQQTETIFKASGLPKDLKDQYDKKLAYVNQLIGAKPGSQAVHEPITCSVVESIGKIPIPGVQQFGHILVIPEFGHVALGEVQVSEKKYEGIERPCVSFELTSIRTKMGCVGDGPLSAGTVTANGAHKP
ncbi:MAG TPA: hypothetical protein VH350_02155 [Candidatus Sulfotelmatobacter sp.]|nr:hypothetical protein [Candidatus Sulfotelmatobacter sp.]